MSTPDNSHESHDHCSGHDHNDYKNMHGHNHDHKLSWAFAGNFCLSLIQIVGGVLSGSLALVADALHNLSDAAALMLALIAGKIARRRPDKLRTYGYRKVETLSAFTNYVALVMVSSWLIIEAITRFFQPHDVVGLPLIWISSLAVFVNLGTVALTYRGAQTSQNMRAAYLHNLGDAISSIGIIIAGFLILAFDWYWVDPLITLVISLYILWQVGKEMMPVINILIDAAPRDHMITQIDGALRAHESILDVHHIHLRSLDEHNLALEAHIVTTEMENQDSLRQSLKALLYKEFQISHASLELENKNCGIEECSVKVV